MGTEAGNVCVTISELQHKTGIRGQKLLIKIYINQLVIILILLLLPLAGYAQEGHPLKGTWRGEIAMADAPVPVVIIMDYKNDGLTGMINPGRNSFNFSEAELDAPNWTLTANAVSRDGMNVSFEAVLHEIGARNRYMEGTWTVAGTTYPFKITRE